MRIPIHFPTTRPPTRRRPTELLLAALFLGLGIFAAGCSDMIDQSRYDPYAPSSLWADGRSARVFPTGVVPVDQVTAGNPLLSGKGPDGSPVTSIPVPVTVDLMKHGEVEFNIYCSPCHGYAGQGNGIAVQHGMPAPPNFHTQAIYNLPDGTIFDVITNGYGRMFSYGYRIQPADRWAVIAYVRALELSQDANPQQLTPDERQKLEAMP